MCTRLPGAARAALTLTTVTLALAVSAPLLAQDRVTVVMREGNERVSGNFEDLATGTVYVRESLQSQRKLPLSGILLMDFAGSAQNLPENELRDARGDDHLLVLRSGSASKGRLLNIEGGDGSAKPGEPRIVSFKTTSGEERRVRPSEIARLYLGRYPAQAGGGSQPQPPAAGPAGPGMSVPGNRVWTRTGITVQQGQTVRFEASGQVRLSGNANDTASPAGSSSGRMAPGSPMPGVLAGALIGRIDNGAPFGIGNQPELRMPAGGELSLGINDDDPNDNSGEFRVKVTPLGGGRRPR